MGLVESFPDFKFSYGLVMTIWWLLMDIIIEV